MAYSNGGCGRQGRVNPIPSTEGRNQVGKTAGDLQRIRGIDGARSVGITGIYFEARERLQGGKMSVDQQGVGPVNTLPGRRIQNFQGLVARYEALDGPIALATAQALAGVLAYAVDGPDGDTDQRG